MRKMITAIVTAVLAMIGAGVLTGCQSVSRPPALTIAVTATSIDPVPALGPIAQMATDNAAAALLPEDGRVTVVTPDQIQTVDLTPMRGKDVESVQTKANKAIATNLDSLTALLGKTGTAKDGLDVIGVLDRALEQTPAGGHVILESSGFSTVPPVDLNQGGDWMAKPEAFVTAVNPADLPHAEGKHVTFYGLGYPNPASAQEQAGPAARTALTTIMLGLCAKMHAASCDTLPGSPGQTPAVSTNKVTPVSLDQITTHCVGQASIDANIAFTENSYEILPAADKTLAPIAQALARCPAGSKIDAVGHSALLPGETPGAHTRFEQDRAQAVLNRLTALGAPAETIGTATPGGQILDNLPGGIYDEALAARNRTVTLTMH